MKLYTKTGDCGQTTLIGGERVSKCDVRVEAYGTVDELSANVALLSDMLRDEANTEEYVADLNRVGSHLMTVAALLAVGCGGEGKVAEPSEEVVATLERRIDELSARVKPITKFTIAGGNKIVSMCHVCRTVCRRAERAALRANAEHGVSAQALVYLNRLSDYLYILGRALNEAFDVEEILWVP
ncbi:MAG: cob(I)yrinic acid a,c-diamide adenosyltransferase [Rikenellaceae bacterium]|nr:cob(I)yrinic acid a,c-diamide adenosyltransferase [Rikenellaceae bacterium]MBQ3255319.1 cob(I)yrinic acid a,c-diamide adenosyltransferase [Rikenellaceae bacterium]